MFLSSTTGIYESTNGGTDWQPLRAGAASDLVLVKSNGTPDDFQLIAAFYGSGLWTSTWTGGAWSTWTQISNPAFPGSFFRIALGQLKNNPTAIYAAFSSGDGIAGMAKTIDGGASWIYVTPPLSPPSKLVVNSSYEDNQFHTVFIPKADLTLPVTGHTYTTSSAGTSAHTHTLT